MQTSVFKKHCIDLLSSHTVATVPQPKSIIQIQSTTGVYEAFQILLNNDILSAPVYDEDEKSYTGFLDVRDVVSYVVFIHDEQKIQNNTQLADVIKHGLQLHKTPTTDGANVRYLSRRNKFLPVSKSASLLDVVKLLAAPNIHRVPILDDGKLIGIVTQTMIMTFLSKHLKETTFDKSHDPAIQDLTIGTHPVLSLPMTKSVIDTFRLMDTKKRSGIALVDDNERLVGTTTGKDLGLFIKNPTLNVLHSQIFEYLKEVRQTQIEIRAPLIAVFTGDKVSKVVGLIAATRVHRVYVVDNETNYKLERVISITDILTYIICE